MKLCFPFSMGYTHWVPAFLPSVSPFSADTLRENFVTVPSSTEYQAGLVSYQHQSITPLKIDILSDFTECSQSHQAKASETISSTWWRKIQFFILLPQKCQISFFYNHHIPINSDWLNIESGNTWGISVFFRVHGSKAAWLHGCISQ